MVIGLPAGTYTVRSMAARGDTPSAVHISNTVRSASPINDIVTGPYNSSSSGSRSTFGSELCEAMARRMPPSRRCSSAASDTPTVMR